MREPVLFEEAVEPAPDLLVGREEGLPVRETHLLKLVPVRPARRERQGATRRHAQHSTLRIENVEERVEVVLVRTPAVEEDERAGGIPRRRPYFVLHAARGSGNGVRTSSRRSRSCS